MTQTPRVGWIGLLLAGLCAGLGMSLPAAHAAGYRTGFGTREVEDGAVLTNDLIFVEGGVQRAARYYPQSAVVHWDPITQPGRYRVTLRARTERFGASTLVLQAWVRQEDGGLVFPTGYGPIPVPVASIPVSGYAFEAPGKWQTFSLAFDVESSKPTRVGLMYVGDKTCEAGTAEVETSSLKLEKLDLPVSISWARPLKLRYKHAEEAALDIRLTNATGEPQDDQVFINPVISHPSRQMEEMEEGCLSLPEIRAPIRRPKEAVIDALDMDGTPIRLASDGLSARIWQHETDHLDCVLIIDKMAGIDRMVHRRALRNMEEAAIEE